MSRIPYTNKVGETLGSIADSAAAYSLRALNGGDPMVARVRRSSDDAEKDFTASDMDSGSVADWVNGKQDTTLPCDVASAAAAYSLRSVNSNYTGSVIRVRRSSDDAEKDFTASDVSGGALVDWVNEDVVTTLNAEDNSTNGWATPDGSSGSTSSIAIELSSPITGSYSYKFANTTTGTSGTYPRFRKESLPFNFTAGNIYNIKCKIKLISGSASLAARIGSATVTGNQFLNYTSLTLNNVLEVDGTITPTSIGGLQNAIEFNFDGRKGAFEVLCDDIEITQLTSNGHVTTWYDQSGNGNNATQSTASSQPKLVDGGTLVSDGIKFDGVDDLLGVDSDLGMSGDDILKSMFSVATNSSTTTRYIISLGNNNDNSPFIHLSSANNYYRYAERGNTNSGDLLEGGTFGGLSVISGLNSGTSRTLYGEGSLIQSTTLDLPSFTLNKFTIGALGRTTNTGFWDNSISEIIIYDSDQSSNRFKIESNINNHYVLYTNANDGFVTSWYDQSGNDNHATQSTAGSQPKIVDGGTLVSDGIKFDGADDLLSGPDLLLGTASRSLFVLARPTSIVSSPIVDLRSTTTTGGSYALTPEIAIRCYGPTWVSSTPASILVKNLISSIYTSGNLHSGNSVYLDGESITRTSGTDGVLVDATGNLSVGGSGGFISEIIVYNSDQSSNRAAIETNINNYYDIY